jgi:hypothetical protein
VCSAAITPDEEAAARETALQWLELVDSGDYDHAAGQTPEQIGVQQHWQNYLTARRKPLGRVKSRQIVEVKHKPNVRGAAVWWKYCAIRLKTSFERPPAAMEEIVLTKMSCCWEVSGYTIFEPGKWNETRDHAGQYQE